MKNIKWIKIAIRIGLYTVCSICTLYLIIFLIFRRDVIASWCYLKFNGAEIISMERSLDGEDLFTTFRINSKDPMIAKVETNWNSIWGRKEYYVEHINFTSLLTFTIDTSNTSLDSIVKYGSPVPYRLTSRGIHLSKSGNRILFPFRINSIGNFIIDIAKIDSALLAIPKFPEAISICIDNGELLYSTRVNYFDMDSINMIIRSDSTNSFFAPN